MVLQLAVPACLRRMRAQEITQVNVITMRLAARHYYVQVVIGAIRRRRERLPALDAQISLVPPSPRHPAMRSPVPRPLGRGPPRPCRCAPAFHTDTEVARSSGSQSL